MMTEVAVTGRSAASIHVRELSLEDLMARHVSGDATSFAELYRRVAPKLLGALIKMTSDRSRAEDILQITMMKVHRARESYAPGAPVMPWVYVIAKRSLFDDQRPLSNRLEVLSADGTLNDADRPVVPESFEERARVREALNQLPKQYRDAIELTKLTGLSGNEAASQLNTTKAAIKQRVHRGYAILRQLLESLTETEMPATA